MNDKNWNSKTDWEVCLWSDLVVDGTNEDGEDIIRERLRVCCENSFGDRYLTKFSTFDRNAAVYHSIRVATYMKKHGSDPSKSNKWYRGNAVYCSAAYTSYGQAEEVAWERACEAQVAS